LAASSCLWSSLKWIPGDLSRVLSILPLSGCSHECSWGEESVPGANGTSGRRAAIPVAPAAMAVSEPAIQG